MVCQRCELKQAPTEGRGLLLSVVSWPPAEHVGNLNFAHLSSLPLVLALFGKSFVDLEQALLFDQIVLRESGPPRRRGFLGRLLWRDVLRCRVRCFVAGRLRIIDAVIVAILLIFICRTDRPRPTLTLGF